MIETLGETSAVFFNYKLCNVIQKVPVPGDYHVIAEYGAIDRVATLDEEGLKVCQNALRAIPSKDPLLLSRIDLIRDN